MINKIIHSTSSEKLRAEAKTYCAFLLNLYSRWQDKNIKEHDMIEPSQIFAKQIEMTEIQ